MVAGMNERFVENAVGVHIDVFCVASLNFQGAVDVCRKRDKSYSHDRSDDYQHRCVNANTLHFAKPPGHFEKLVHGPQWLDQEAIKRAKCDYSTDHLESVGLKNTI